MNMSTSENNPTVPIQQASQLCGLSVHMLTYLSRVEILTPTRGGVRGRRRLYSFNDVIFLKVIADLLAHGVEVKRLKQALTRARSEAAVWIDIKQAPRRYLVTDGTEIFVRREGKLESKTVNGQLAFAFVLDLRSTHKSIADAWPVVRSTRRA
jgi:DNA-binding transcriptional MerR regulator